VENGTYVAVAVIAFITTCVVAYHSLLLYTKKILGIYMIMYGIIAFAITVMWGMLSSWSFHLHHTMAGVLVIPITRFPNRISSVVQALAFGIFIQGYAAWGWGSLFEYPRKCIFINFSSHHN